MAASVLFATGCVAPRGPEVTVEPSYSWLRDQPTLSTGETWPVQPDPFADRPTDRFEPGSSEFRWPRTQ